MYRIAKEYNLRPSEVDNMDIEEIYFILGLMGADLEYNRVKKVKNINK